MINSFLDYQRCSIWKGRWSTTAIIKDNVAIQSKQFFYSKPFLALISLTLQDGEIAGEGIQLAFRLMLVYAYTSTKHLLSFYVNISNYNGTVPYCIHSYELCIYIIVTLEYPNILVFYSLTWESLKDLEISSNKINVF